MWQYNGANELYHYGVQGMKWGVRRYQNPDGSLTPAGKKRQESLTRSNRKATIAEGTTVYRVSDSDKSDASDDKMYVSATKESGDYYIQALGSGKIVSKGKAFTHEYVTTTELKMPDKRTMEKIELGLLKDKEVQKELIDSLMAKGMSREQATSQVRAYSAGKAFAEKCGDVTAGALVGGSYGAMLGLYGGNLASIGVGAAGGAVLGGVAGALAPSRERERALTVARASYGDKNNKVINETVRNELAKRGYNAMKDYNDRRAFGEKGSQAVIVFDSNKNLKVSKISEITSTEYGKSYARNYLKANPKSKLDFNDLVKDGEAAYKKLYETGVIAREREKENQRLLEKAKKNSR